MATIPQPTKRMKTFTGGIRLFPQMEKFSKFFPFPQ